MRTETPPAERAGTPRERVDAYLHDLEADPAAVREAIHALTGREMEPYGFRSYHFNLLSLYGDRWSPEEVERAAVAATHNKLWRGWEFYSGWRRLRPVMEAMGVGPEEPAPSLVTLEGWDEVLAALDREEGPVVACSMHVGAYRNLFLDLALLGRAFALPLDTEGFRQNSEAVRLSHPAVARSFNLVNAEASTGVLALTRAARRVKVVSAFVDGNTGADGPWGTQGRTPVEFLGFRLRVKDGMPRLAGALGATVIPLAAPRLDPFRARVVAGPPLRPGGRLKGEAQDAFAREATQAVYSFFEGYVRAAPSGWDSLCFLHRWREPEPSAPAGAAPDPERRLAEGAAFRLDRRRVVVVPDAAGPLLLDVRSLKSVRVPEWAAPALGALEGAGLGREWLAGTGGGAPGARERVLALLAELEERGVIVPG